ncbi:hypothetical protein AAFO90_24995, partial [Phaeobacter sp. CAU 1743]|uniref:hypothetical protein n=1 Tax=Phaeobacter sp. CAU 1743 TaxID=3140367 RepID=UPI00325BC26B
TAGKPSLSPSNPCPLTSQPKTPTLHMPGARRQGISTAFATRPFAQARILFQEQRAEDYIPDVLRLLTEDGELDEVLKLGAGFFGKSAPAKCTSELEADLALRHRKARTASDFTASIVEDYLLPGSDGRIGARALQKRKDQVYRLLHSDDAQARALWDQWTEKSAPSRFLLQNFPSV